MMIESKISQRDKIVQLGVAKLRWVKARTQELVLSDFLYSRHHWQALAISRAI
jgi:hypothetical protein